MTTTAHILRKALLAATIATLLLAAPSQAATLRPAPRRSSRAPTPSSEADRAGRTTPRAPARPSAPTAASWPSPPFRRAGRGRRRPRAEHLRQGPLERSGDAGQPTDRSERRSGARELRGPRRQRDGSRVGFTCPGPLDAPTTTTWATSTCAPGGQHHQPDQPSGNTARSATGLQRAEPERQRHRGRYTSEAPTSLGRHRRRHARPVPQDVNAGSPRDVASRRSRATATAWSRATSRR